MINLNAGIEISLNFGLSEIIGSYKGEPLILDSHISKL